jgi:hypothetical protein
MKTQCLSWSLHWNSLSTAWHRRLELSLLADEPGIAPHTRDSSWHQSATVSAVFYLTSPRQQGRQDIGRKALSCFGLSSDFPHDI